MQTELIIVSEYCHKCHIEPSFIEMLEEGGLINVHTEAVNIICFCRNSRTWNVIAECTMTYPSTWKVSMPFIICWKGWKI